MKSRRRGGMRPAVFLNSTGFSSRHYLSGRTASTDFPDVNALQPTPAGEGDAFAAKIDATGSTLVYATYFGGSGLDIAYDIAVDSGGNAYLSGRTASTDLPTQRALQPASGGEEDGFVAKIDAAGSALVYATYLGGSGEDIAHGIALDDTGSAYITGSTASSDFPLAQGKRIIAL
ncbi:hypothetical protein CKO41_18185 [Thiococcus pfennigii]|nr:hypothetical protein [Thiococcus pfennigii]